MSHSIKQRPGFGNRGDTIIEVMIVLAVLGLAFAVGMATAYRGLNQSRTAEEHSQALGVLSSQLELVRSAIAKGADVTGNPRVFCMTGPTQPADFPAAYTAFSSSNQDSSNSYANYPPSCVKDFYHISLKNSGTDYLTAQVRWDGVGDLGPQQERFVYRIHALSNTDSVISLTTVSSQLAVGVLPLLPPSETSLPTCGNARTGSNRGGVNVSLDTVPPSTTSTQTSADSRPMFFDVKDGGRYKVSLDTATVPPGFSACPPTQSNAFVVTPGEPVAPVNFRLLPKGWVANGRDFSRCDRGEPGSNDGYDGCFINGTSVFARRAVNISYNLGSAMPAAGNIVIVINYNQYSGAGTVPPPGYGDYSLTLKFNNSPNSTLNLPIESSTAAYTARTATFQRSLPGGTSVMELDWTNNRGNDPDLQINSLQLYYR